MCFVARTFSLVTIILDIMYLYRIVSAVGARAGDNNRETSSSVSGSLTLGARHRLSDAERAMRASHRLNDAERAMLIYVNRVAGKA